MRKKGINYLIDTGIFIAWYRGDKSARSFFHHLGDNIYYYSKQTYKELLRPPISDSESRTIKRFLGFFRRIDPDESIAVAYSNLLEKYPYLQNHLPDAIIAATA